MGFSAFRPHSSIIAATLLILVSTLIPLLPKHWSLRLQVPFRVAAFVALTMLLENIVGSPLNPHFDAAHPTLQLWQKCIEAGWFIVAGRAAVSIARLAVVLENRPRETRIASDLLAGAIYVATILAIINFAFEVPIRGVLATSGILAIVLGLALQSTLADVFSGIAVGLERPYKPGDLIWVEGNIEGRVVQLNWRSTQIATGQDNIAIIPNSIMAKARIINRSAPTPARGDSISLELDPSCVPEDCIATIEAAILACSLLLDHPRPTVRLDGLKGDGATYEICFSVASSEVLAMARAELLSLIHRYLRHSGIALAIGSVATLARPHVATARELLEQSELFGSMDSLDRDLLAEHLRPEWLNAGQTLLREGEPAQALFVVAEGTAVLTKANDVIHHISPGDSFGMVALVTGTASELTVAALTRMKVYRLDKADICGALSKRPELSAALETLAKNGRAALSRFATTHEKAQLAEPDVFLHRLRSFLYTIVH
jgi:small-conductance mechanosensitive channel/CRP-like cAMP-binding protein